MNKRLLSILLVFLGLAFPLRAQETPDDVKRMVDQGMAEALEARYRGAREPEKLGWIARAYANKARNQRDASLRANAWKQADEKYGAWIDSLRAQTNDVADRVRLAAAIVDYGNMILSGQAAGDLDEWILTGGQRGDVKQMQQQLMKADQQYDAAKDAMEPLLADLSYNEEALLAAGVYDRLIQTSLDRRLNQAWTQYFLGVLEKKEVERNKLLSAAGRLFQDLIDSGHGGQTQYQCFLGLAMTQREEGRFTDAERNFQYALSDNAGVYIVARTRVEFARALIDEGKFDEARRTLRPLTSKDLRTLSPEDAPARFYINLAHVWDANSYLLEAEAVRKQARESTARTAILQQAQRARETGLTKFKRLADMGGPWPALVQVYISASVDLRTPPAQLTPIELLYTATTLIDARRYEEARDRLHEALRREDADKETLGNVLFELGRCEFQRRNLEAAAEAFSRLAADYRGHEKAPQAATFAYQLWGRVAEQTGERSAYLKLAETLKNLIESYADHPDREQALWLLPVALQQAGQFDEAAEHFAKVPDSSGHYEEAQYRRVICRRSALEASQESLKPEQYRQKAREVAQELSTYAGAAFERAPSTLRPEKVRAWSAAARVAAADLLASASVGDYAQALELLNGFEQQYPDSERIGAVLAARIRAYRGLRQFDRAAAILRQFLDTADPGQVGATLAGLARGMQEEVERLLEAGQEKQARQLAEESIATFEELEKWVRADPSRERNLPFVLSGRARMHYLAGQYEPALALADQLLEKDPRNGNFQQLRAEVLTAQLDENSSQEAAKPQEGGGPEAGGEPTQAGAEPPEGAKPRAGGEPSREALEAARDAWAKLLADPAIRTRAPERYWQARYQWLRLKLKLGEAADVAKAITQEKIWYPALGGKEWKPKFEALLKEAQEKAGAESVAPDKSHEATKPRSHEG